MTTTINLGQLLIEVHSGEAFSGSENPLKLLDIFEAYNMRIFHKEGNYVFGRYCCSEWYICCITIYMPC